jgi:MFS family permease
MPAAAVKKSADLAGTMRPPRPTAVLAAVCACTALVVGMVASVNLAVPMLAASSLHPSASALVWIVDTYVVFFACLVIPGGAAGDRLGRKGVLLTGLGLFGVGAVLSATAPGVPQMLAGRAVTGLGAAAVLPNSLAVLLHAVPVQRRASAIATWASMTGVGGVLGNVGGGALLHTGSWRGLFAAAALLAAGCGGWVAAAAARTERHQRPLQPLSVTLLTLACLALLVGIIQGPDGGWSSVPVIGGFAASILLFTAWGGVEWGPNPPLPPPRLFRIPLLRSGCLGLFAMFFGMFALFYVNASFLQYGKGLTVLQAGLGIAPMAVVMVIGARLAGPIAARIGRHATIAAAFGLVGTGLLGLSACSTATPYLVYAAYLLVVGSGVALALPGLSADIAGSLPATHAGVGAGLQSTTRELGSALGVAVISTIMTSRFVAALPPALRHSGHTVAQTLATAHTGQARTAVLHAFVTGASTGLRAVAIATLTGGLLVTTKAHLTRRIAVLALVRVHTPQFQAPAPKPVNPSHGARVAAVGRNGEGLRTAVDKPVTRTHHTSDVMPESPMVTGDNTDNQPLMAQTTVPAQPAPARPVPERAARLPAAAAAAAPERPVRGPMADPSAPVGSSPDIDVRQLRHPSERSRFAFSASVSLLLMGLGLLLTLRLGGIRWLVGLAALVPVALGLLWCLARARLAHLLSGAARVTPETFPELSAAASKLERRLGHMPAEMFVTAKTGDPVVLTSFLGTHVLLLNGDLAAELAKPGNRPQLDFILATFFGKLEVKALAWAPARIAFDALRLTRVLNVLIAPWERATVYSGDQVAAVCCGRLEESVIALNRLLVGKDLAPSVGMTGLMAQAVSVRRRWFPRLQEICSSSPHMTSRYLNLLSFAGQTAPEQARAFHESLKHRTALKVRDVLARPARLRSRRRRRGLLPLSLGASIVLLGAAAFGMFPSGLQHPVAGLQKTPGTPSAAAAMPRGAGAAPSAAPSASPAFPGTLGAAVAGLESHVPPAFAGKCTPLTPQAAMTGLVAAIACTPTGSGAPVGVQYYRFANTAGMNAAFNRAASGVTGSGTCDQGGQRGTYQFSSGPVSGMWACYYTAGKGQLIWTSTKFGIMGLADGPGQTPQQLSDWFFSPAATGPQ